jgi:hypothetical protein
MRRWKQPTQDFAASPEDAARSDEAVLPAGSNFDRGTLRGSSPSSRRTAFTRLNVRQELPRRADGYISRIVDYCNGLTFPSAAQGATSGDGGTETGCWPYW